MMNYKYECNSEIKQVLRQYGITYEEIAEKAKYSVQTIKEWKRHILTPEREAIIKTSIEKLLTERDEFNNG